MGKKLGVVRFDVKTPKPHLLPDDVFFTPALRPQERTPR
jgi:hypothetical protein